jgi:hypothetical protein
VSRRVSIRNAAGSAAISRPPCNRQQPKMPETRTRLFGGLGQLTPRRPVGQWRPGSEERENVFDLIGGVDLVPILSGCFIAPVL